MTEPTIEDLFAEGFAHVTNWIVRDGRIRLASLDWPETGGWLYSFVVDDKVVKYIGLSTRVLRSRMDNYRDNGDQNQRIRELITAQLNDGRTVSIYGRPEEDPKRLAEEEERLRAELRPTWNLV